MSGFLRGQFVQNVLHFKYDPPGTETDFESALNVGQHIVTYLADVWFGCLPVDYIGSSIRAQVFPTATIPGSGPAATVQTGFNGMPGGRTGSIAVTSIGPIVVMPFEVAGKPRSGKIFLPGVTENDVNNNRLSDELLSAINDLTTILNADIAVGGSGTLRLNVYSFLEDNLFQPEGMYVSTQVGSIRKRQRPHG